MTAVTNEMVAAHHPEIAKMARSLSWNGPAEFDDLFQEGQIAVWLCLKKQQEVTTTFIRWRMLNWVSFIRRNKEYELEDE